MTQIPAYLQKSAPRGLAQAATANLGTARPPTLSISGNKFTLIDAAGNTQPFVTMDAGGPYADVVIVDLLERMSRLFYEEEFDPNASGYAPPDCWSDNGIGPSRQSAKPQSPTCADCPNAVWGSATSRVTGKAIPACTQLQKIAVLVPGMGENVFVLRVPPNSLKNFRSFAESFRGQGFDMDAVVTRLSFVSQGTLQFKAVNWVDEQTHGIAQKAIAAKATDVIIGRLDVAASEVALPTNRPSAQIEHQPQGGPGHNETVETIQRHAAPAETTQQAAQPATAPTGRGRRKAAAAAPATEQPGPNGTAPTGPAQAPFRMGAPPSAAAPAQTGFDMGKKEESAQPGTFGFANAPAPTGGIAADLNAVFGKK